MLAVFAHLAPVRPRGGGTLVITCSHQLTTPSGPQAGNAPARPREVKAYLATVHPWLLDLWKADGDTDRIHRYLTAGAVIDGVPVQVEELTGEPGDAVIMHPRLLHVVAPNTLLRFFLSGCLGSRNTKANAAARGPRHTQAVTPSVSVGKWRSKV